MAGIKIKFDTNDVERQIKNIIKDATEQLKNPIEGKIEFKSDDLAKLTEQIGKLGEAFNKIDFSKLNQLGESTKQGKAVIDGVSDSLSKVNVKLNDSSDNIKQFQKSIESLLQSGDKLKNITQVLNPDTKELQGFNVAIEKTNGQIQKMKYYLQDASKEGASFSRIDLKIVDGQQIKQLEQMLNMLNKIEDKFSNIKLTPHGDSLKELDNLKKQLNEQLNSFTNGNDINIDFSKVKQQISSLGDELSKVQKQDLTTIDKKENLYNKVLDIQKKLFQNQIDQTKAGETRLRQLQQEEKIIKSSLEANSKLYFDQFGKKQLNNELTSNQKKQDSKLNTISTNNIDNERQQQLNDLVRESEQEYSKLNNLLNQEYELKNKLINKEGEERKALEDSLKIIQSKRDAQLEYINAEGLSNKYSTQSYLGNVSNKQFTLDTNTNQYNGKVEDDISKYKAKMLNALDEVERAYKSKNGDLKFKINGIDETKGKIEDLILSMNKVNCEQVKQKVTSAMKEIRSQINETDSATNKWGSSLTKAIGNTLKYGIAYNAMYSAMSAFTDQIREGLSFMVDLDTAQSNIIMITGKTREEVQGLTKDYANLAGQLHDTTLNTMQEGEEFLRAGYTDDESSSLIKSSTLASKISGGEPKEVADELIAMKNAFNMPVQGFDGISGAVDKLTKLDNESATSFKELAIAMSKTSASAQGVGVDFDHLSAYVATVSSITRKSASTIGESYKTIFSRFEDVKGGKKFDPDNEDISNVERDLKKVGIAIRSDKDTFKDFGTVIDQVAQKWKSGQLTDVQQSTILKSMAGTRQRETLKTLLDNWDTYKNLLQKENDASGSAQKAVDNGFNQSIQAKINDLKNSMEKLWMGIYNSETLKNAISGITTFVDSLRSLSSVSTSSIVSLGLLSGAIILLVKNFRLLITAMMESTSIHTFLTAVMDKLFGTLATGVGITGMLSGALGVLKGALTALFLTPQGLAFLGLATAIGVATYAVTNHIKHQQDLKQKTDELTTSYKNLNNAIKNNDVEGMKSGSQDLKGTQTNYQNLLKQQKEAQNKVKTLNADYQANPMDFNKQADVSKAEGELERINNLIKDQKDELNGAGIAFSELTGEIYKVTEAEGKLQNNDVIEGINKTSQSEINDKDAITELGNEYIKLSNSKNKNSVESERMGLLADLLKNKVQGLIVARGEDGNSVVKNTGLLNTEIGILSKEGLSVKDLVKVKLEASRNEAVIQSGMTRLTYEGAKARIKILKDEADAWNSSANMEKPDSVTEGIMHQQGQKTLSDTLKGFSNNNLKETNKIQEQLDAVDKSFDDAMKSIDGANGALKDSSFTTDGDTSSTNKNTKAKQAQAQAIEKVKELTKEYETELKNLDNIQQQMETNQKHMDDTSQAYRNSLQEEINLLQQKNGFLQKGVNLNNSQIGRLAGYTGTNGYGSQLGQQIVNTAEQYLGTPYAYGGESPNGFDCSGLVQYVYDKVGVALNRRSQEQFSQGTPVSKADLQPGDLVFFAGSDGTLDSPGHVGIYAGGEEYIQAPHTGDVVKVSNLNDRSDYAGARRLTGDATSNGVSTESLPTSMTYKEMIDSASSKYGLDPNLISAVIEQESSWKADEKTGNAVGLMQLMPDTAESMGLSADQRTDPLKNIMAGTQYLSELINKYGEEKGIALYNTGENGGGNYGYASSVLAKKQAYENGSSSVPNTTADVSNDTNVLSEMDSLNSKTEEYQKKMSENASLILDKYTQIYESQTKFYDKEVSESNKELDLLKGKYDLYEKDSTILNDSSRQYKQLELNEINQQYGILKQKEDYIKSQMNSNKYDQKSMSQMAQDLLDVQNQEIKTTNDLHSAIKDWLSDRLTWKTQGQKDNIEQYDAQLNLLNDEDSSGSSAKTALNQKKLEQQREITDAIKEQYMYVHDLYTKEQYGTTKQLYADQLKDINKQLVESQDEVQKIINTLRDANISKILDDTDKQLKEVNNDLKEIDVTSTEVGDNNTSQKLIDSMNKASDYVDILKQDVNAYNQIFNEVSADGIISTDEQKKLDEQKNKIDADRKNIAQIKQDIESLKLSNIVAPFEQAISKITNNFSKLDYQLQMLGSTDYANKTDILSQQLGLNDSKTNAYLDEYQKLMNQSATAGTKEAEILSSKLAEVRDKLIEASKEGQNLKKELQDASLSAIFQQIQKPKDKLNQQISDADFAVSMGKNKGLALGTDFFKVDTETDAEKISDETKKISDVVDNINGKIGDLTSATLDIDTDSIVDKLDTTTDTTNKILTNINQSVNDINKNNSESVVTKNVYGSSKDKENFETLAKQYGLEGIFNVIDTSANDFSWAKQQLTSNDIVLGGVGASNGLSDNSKLNNADRLEGKGTQETKNAIDKYLQSLLKVIENRKSTNGTTSDQNEELLKELGVNNTNSETIAKNTGDNVTVTTTQTTTLTKTADDVAKSVNDNVNSNFTTLNETLTQITTALTSLNSSLSAIKDLEGTDLGQIITDLKVIDTKTIIQELINLHGSLNALGDLVASVNSGSDKDYSFSGTEAVSMPSYDKDNDNNKVDKKAYGGEVDGSVIVGDGEGDNAGYELVVLPNGRVIKVGENGFTLTKLPKGSKIISHVDSEKILKQGGIAEIPKYANGSAKIKIYAKDVEANSLGLGDFEYAQKVTAGRTNIMVVKYENSDDITKNDYVMGDIPSGYNINESHRLQGSNRTVTHQYLDNLLEKLSPVADESDVQTTDSSTTSIKPTTTNASDYNKTSSSYSSSNPNPDWTNIEDTDYRKQLNNEISTSKQNYTTQLENGASDSNLIQTEIDSTQKTILLNNDAIKQLEKKSELYKDNADALKKIADEQENLNKEMEDAQKKLEELAKTKVDALLSDSEEQLKNTENNIKKIGTTSTPDELENDKRKIEILQERNKELKIYEDELKKISSEESDTTSLVTNFKSDKLNSSDNSTLISLLLKQVNGETLTDTQNKTLTTLETTLKKLDPSQSTYLLSIIDYLKAIKDKKTDVQVNVQNSKDEQNSEEYSMAQQIIQNMKSLDEAKFAQNKKDWSKQLFAVSEDEWNNYKTSKIAQLQNEMQQAQSEFSNDPSNTYLSDEVASKSNDIANLQKQNYKDIYDWEQTFTDVHQQRIAQLEEENKLQQEKEEKLKRENDLLQKEKELNDTLNNKDVETITKDANGNWQTSYVSDQTKVDELQKSIGEQMQSNNDADRQQKIENEKEFENDLINTQKNAYDKLVKDQQNILDKKYANMNYLVETFLGEIKSEYGSDSNVVKSVLSGMLNRTEGDLRDFTIKSSGYIKEMVDYIKSLKIEVKQSGADVSAVVNGIPSVSNGTATTDQIQKLNDLLNDPNPSPDMVKFKEDMFSSDPTKQAEAKQIIAKYLPSETDVDKWLQTQNDAYYKSISNNGSGSSTNKTNEQKISDYKNSSEYKSIQQQAQNAVVNGDSAKISELHQQALDLQKQYDIAQAKEGGQTPLWGNEGKLMVVHEGELIPNKLQSKDILNASEILKKLNLDNMLTNFNPTNILSKLNLSLPSFNKLQPVIQTTTQTFKFDKIVLPNVTKGDEFIEELKTNFVNYVIQDNGK